VYLSPKKQRFVDFINSFTVDNDRPPTFVEIMDGLNIRSLGTINWYVNELENAGVIKRMNGFNGKRALSVLEKHIDNSLPLLGLIAAGYPLEVFENIEHIEVPPSFIHPDNFVLRVNGDSMKDDGILDRDLIIVKKTDVAKSGETIVAYVNNEATLKEYRVKKGRVELHPKNADYDIINVLPSDEFEVGGKILGIIRSY
jgi:repressor LexA